jgi:Lysyl oxidase
MRRPRRGLRTAAVAIAGLGLVAAVIPAAAQAAGRSRATAEGPTVKLIAAQNTVTAQRFGGMVFFDPGIWVASVGSALEFDVQRATYLKPLTISQVIHLPGGGRTTRALPGSLLDGWVGLRNFVRLTIRNAKGKVVARELADFCPDTFDPERASPESPTTSTYPQQCESDPFQKADVWGITRGWAVDPFEQFFAPEPAFRLPLGTYRATVSIVRPYTGLLHISAADATATVRVKVVRGGGPVPVARTRRGAPLASLPSNVPDIKNAPREALPDLVPLPSWGINTARSRHQDFLDFGATVWIGGSSPLDVEGFRSHGSPTMLAYQYFWRNGRLIGRARVGTMGFAGYNHWHFQQFAKYRLLNASKAVAVRSHKEGFCIAPTDNVDLLLHGAVWQPSSVGLGGQCGSPTALWVQEYLPLGWGDTYIQDIPGQSFNITNVPNGTYYIEVIANPLKVLRESNMSNDISLRRIILGGRKGHRTVRVPAWHGIDPENSPPPVPVPTPSPTPVPSTTSSSAPSSAGA